MPKASRQVTVTIYLADSVVNLYRKAPNDTPDCLTRRYKALTAQKRFRDAFPRYAGACRSLRFVSAGGSYADYGMREIRMGQNRCEATLLHEIAHHVARSHAAYGYCRDHGPGFASAFLDVVKVAQGVEAERALRHLYRALRIRVYKAGSAKGVLPRAPGDAPAKAQSAIDRIVKARDAGKAERAMLRSMIAAVTDPSREGDHEMPCPACAAPAVLRIRYVTSWASRGSNGLDYSARCEAAGCGFSEYHRVAGKAYRALRAKHREAA